MEGRILCHSYLFCHQQCTFLDIIPKNVILSWKIKCFNLLMINNSGAGSPFLISGTFLLLAIFDFL